MWAGLIPPKFDLLYYATLQLEITALSYGKGPRIEAGAEEGADGGKNLFYGKGFRASFDADGAPPPSKDEQESMAKFWAMEEANTPKGWDDEEELDYAEITSKRKAAAATAQRTDAEQTGWKLRDRKYVNIQASIDAGSCFSWSV